MSMQTVSSRIRPVWIITMMTVFLATASAQQPEMGFAPLKLTEASYRFDTAEQHGIRVDVVVQGLPHPFSLAMLPNGDALIAERGGNLRLLRDATSRNASLVSEPVAGAPPPASARGAGLLDIVLHPDFSDNRLVYFTYNKPGRPIPNAAPDARPSMALTVARARFDGSALSDVEDIFSGEDLSGSSGSRIAFTDANTLYFTSGAPFGTEAQELDSVYGKVLRIRADGSIPDDNPFVGRSGARPEIFSFGHRDQLGLTVHPASGSVLAAEHGPNGGDEINLILPGRDYGWPDYSFGRDYEGPRISDVPLGANVEQPLVLWIPSIAPTGMTFYTADRIPAWTGNLFVGSSRTGEIPGTGGLERIVFNENLEELRRESLLTDLRQRIRDVRQGPDGLLYVVTDEDDGAMLRIAPAN